MKISLLFSLLAVAASHLESAPTPAPRANVLKPPATLSVEASSPPFWISADAATGADGNVNYDVFVHGIREAVQSQAIQNRLRIDSTRAMTPCPQYTIGNSEEPFDTPGDQHSHSPRPETILAGTVTGVTQGFIGPTPGSMLVIHIDDALVDPAGIAGLRDVFVSYLAADFEIGGTRFCNSGVPRNGGQFSPAVGDKILIRNSGTVQGRYLPSRDERLLFGRNDRVYAPRTSIPGVAIAKTDSFDELVRVLRSEQIDHQAVRQ
jgi:hypothetical protein